MVLQEDAIVAAPSVSVIVAAPSVPVRANRLEVAPHRVQDSQPSYTLGNAPEHEPVSLSAHGAPSAHTAANAAHKQTHASLDILMTPNHAATIDDIAAHGVAEHLKVLEKEKEPPVTPERIIGVSATHSPSRATSAHSPSHVASSASKAVSSVAAHALSVKGEAQMYCIL